MRGRIFFFFGDWEDEGNVGADLGEISGFGFWILGIRRHGGVVTPKKFTRFIVT